MADIHRGLVSFLILVFMSNRKFTQGYAETTPHLFRLPLQTVPTTIVNCCTAEGIAPVPSYVREDGRPSLLLPPKGRFARRDLHASLRFDSAAAPVAAPISPLGEHPSQQQRNGPTAAGAAAPAPAPAPVPAAAAVAHAPPPATPAAASQARLSQAARWEPEARAPPTAQRAALLAAPEAAEASSSGSQRQHSTAPPPSASRAGAHLATLSTPQQSTSSAVLQLSPAPPIKQLQELPISSSSDATSAASSAVPPLRPLAVAPSPAEHSRPTATAPELPSGTPAAARGSLPPAADSGRPKFIFLAKIWEELSKGRTHLIETLTLATLLNRTLVLTNVSSSHISYNRTMPMSSYFDVDRMAEAAPVVAQSEFLKSLQRQHCNQSGGLSSVEDSSRPTESMSTPCSLCRVKAAFLIYKFNISDCDKVQPAVVNFARYFLSCPVEGLRPPVQCIQFVMEDSEAEREEALLRAAGAVSQADIIVVFKRTFADHLRPSTVRRFEKFVTYAPALIATADRLIRSLLIPSYLAVHFRIQWIILGLNSSAARATLQKCTDGLLQSAYALQEERMGGVNGSLGEYSCFCSCSSKIWTPNEGTAMGSNEVHSLPAGYLATDIPPRDFHSSNFEIRDKELLEFAYLTLASIRDKLSMAWAGDLRPLLNVTDTGQVGILEKLISMKSARFMAAPLQCGGGSSMFNKEIVAWRMQHNLTVHRWRLVDE